jgi:uncharacterized protein
MTLKAGTKQPCILLDTGLLVALFDRGDKHHRAAVQWLNSFKGTLISVQHVLTEASFFLCTENSAKLIDQIATQWVQLYNPDPAGYKRIAALMRKYADLDPDLADVALVWLAETTGVHSIITVDINDFSTYRINGKSKFNLIPWQSAAY